MSNNGEVADDRDSQYFSYDSARTIDDIAADLKVALSFQAGKSRLGKPGMMIAVEGMAELVAPAAPIIGTARTMARSRSQPLPGGCRVPSLAVSCEANFADP